MISVPPPHLQDTWTLQECAYAVQCSQLQTGEELDTDEQDHVKRVYDKISDRPKQYGFQMCLHGMAVVLGKLLSPDEFHPMLHSKQ